MKTLRATLLSLTVLCLTSCGRAPNYEMMVGDGKGDPPASFSIVRSQDTSMGIDGCGWMSFTIAPEDVAHIVEAGDYVEEADRKTLDSLSPDWWREGIDEERMTYYEWVAYHRGSTDSVSLISVLWIDEENSEGYFGWVGL